MNDDPSSSKPVPVAAPASEAVAESAAMPGEDATLVKTVRRWITGGRRVRNGDASVRATLSELIEERGKSEPVNDEERTLLVNILELRGRTVEDIMVPRAEIVAIEAGAALDEVVAQLTREGHSRLPVFRDSLDNAVGMVHIKDMLAWRGTAEGFRLDAVVRPVLFVAPSMHILELLLEMRVKRCHMALVVDEYGGVDGLLTIEDLVEEIVGEIEDEFDRADRPAASLRADGGVDADARVEIEDLEEMIGAFVSDEEREDADTLGGLVFALAGRVPIRGELITHPSGVEFEILDADPRSIKRLRVRGKPGGAEGKA